MFASHHDASGSAAESVLERLSRTSPGLEIWWDSSPLVYKQWADQLLETVPVDKRPVLTAQLRKLYDPHNPAQTLFRGVTTNPPLSLTTMQADPARWSTWIKNYLLANPSADTEEVFWALYKEIIRLGAESFRPVFDASGYLYGYLSGQVDPRHFFDQETMLAQAFEISALGPNIMIKIPGTREGIAVIRELTSRGISTNCTAAYTVPQFYAVAQAVLEGLDIARRNGIDLTRWRSVVTYMSARWENSPAFDEQAAALGIQLTPEDKRWAGVAIFKQAYRLFRLHAFPCKMLICSVRMGPTIDHVIHSWHLEETAGASAIFTLPPSFLTELFTQGENLHFEPRIWSEVPADVMNRLVKIPYFLHAYHYDGISVDQFNEQPPLLSTFNEFSTATEKMVSFVASRIAEIKDEMLVGS